MEIKSNLVLKITMCFNEQVVDRWEEILDPTQLKSIYTTLRSEYGKCDGKVYQDLAGYNPVHVGWIFKKKVINSGLPVMQIAWCTLYKQVTSEHPVNLKTGNIKRLTKATTKKNKKQCTIQ